MVAADHSSGTPAISDGLVEALGPEVRSALRLDELHVDPHRFPARCTLPSST
jgi:hypothetical protein